MARGNNAQYESWHVWLFSSSRLMRPRDTKLVVYANQVFKNEHTCHLPCSHFRPSADSSRRWLVCATGWGGTCVHRGSHAGKKNGVLFFSSV